MCAVLPMPVRICVIALKTERVCGIRTSRDDASLITELAAPSDAGMGLEELVIALKVGQAPVRLPWLARGSIVRGPGAPLCGGHSLCRHLLLQKASGTLAGNQLLFYKHGWHLLRGCLVLLVADNQAALP